MSGKGLEKRKLHSISWEEVTAGTEFGACGWQQSRGKTLSGDEG